MSRTAFLAALIAFPLSVQAADWAIAPEHVDQALSSPVAPNQFAVALSHQDSPAWTLEGDGSWIRVHSSGEVALHLVGLGLDQFVLWNGVRFDPDASGNIWTDFQPSGSDLLLKGGQGEPTIVRSFHPLPKPKNIGTSGGCNVDAQCVEGQPDATYTNSVVKLRIDNQFLCSGAIINNTSEDRRPLIATARHCGITPANQGSVQTIFGYQREGCGSGARGDTNRRLSGSTLLGESTTGDVALIELSSRIPNEFGPVFAGWDARLGRSRIGGFAFHHPNGDEKKYSRETGAIVDAGSVSFGSFSSIAWGVQWDQGVTEQGSSGSPLFSAENLIIGVLSGGASSCGNPLGPDFFGKLEVAYDESTPIRLAMDPEGGGTQRVLGLFSGTEPDEIAPLPPIFGRPIEEVQGAGEKPIPVEGAGSLSASSIAFLLLSLLAAAIRRNSTVSVVH